MEKQNFLENQIIILTKQTLDVFLKSENPSELVALYVFYYYTAKWQKTNRAKCTTCYAATGLHWSEQRVRKVKKKLAEFGLIEDIQTKGADGKINGHYIKLNYVFCEENHPVGKPQGGQLNTVEKCKTNALSADNSNALSAGNSNALGAGTEMLELEPQKKRTRFIPPTVEEVRDYCLERGNSIDSQRFIDYYTANGWKVGKNPMKDWKASIRMWEGNRRHSGTRSSQEEPVTNNPFLKLLMKGEFADEE